MSADLPGPQSPGHLVGVGLRHFQRLSLMWADPPAQTGRSQGTKAESALEALPTLPATGPWKHSRPRGLVTGAQVGTNRHVAGRLAGSVGGV